ncbi:AmpG family muropeptide MFS transporter [Vitiosangium sp. GDMCC 1.1324]|uniref:AmpG family muropeptide MFS transporter n=1 Tax=Vitiosangium sp. (strain GDMCC 1.1324) TaxID=2138576 RepID=UPI000D39FC73|nr:AmpG family muropeptide MFS transporter [Vitiosangium sp. GDMCC 1.1324]PTL79554.1 AmpG family muropeptide MFS transporter [Vitiosangium sp. GDMCC 1.1324]
MSAKPTLRQVLSNPKTWPLLALGFSSGLPLLLVGGTLSIWMKNQGLNIKTITAFGLVSAPYSFKFVWAPLLDRYALPFLGRRRGWMLFSQVLLLGAIAALSFIDPKESTLLMAGVATLVAFLSASQDVVADALRTDLYTEETERGLAYAVFVTGYRLGILAASPVALTLSDTIGWQRTYWVMASLMVVGMGATFFLPEPHGRPPRNLVDAVVNPFVDYFRRNGAVAVLVFLFLYKLGEAFVGPGIVGPFFVELGFTNTEIGWISKVPNLIASIVGGLLGGVLMIRMGMRRSLYVFGVLQAITNLLYLGLAVIGKSYWALASAIIVDNLCGGMATTASGAFMMALCNKRFSATQFALLSSLANLGGRLLAPFAGICIERMGWPMYFCFTVAISFPSLALLAFLRPNAGVVPPEEPASEPAPTPAVAR